jgi:hypothetical protein
MRGLPACTWQLDGPTANIRENEENERGRQLSRPHSPAEQLTNGDKQYKSGSRDAEKDNSKRDVLHTQKIPAHGTAVSARTPGNHSSVATSMLQPKRYDFSMLDRFGARGTQRFHRFS